MRLSLHTRDEETKQKRYQHQNKFGRNLSLKNKTTTTTGAGRREKKENIITAIIYVYLQQKNKGQFFSPSSHGCKQQKHKKIHKTTKQRDTVFSL